MSISTLPTPSVRRLDRAGTAIVNALRVLPVAGEPGYQTPGELASGLALVFRACLGPMERLALASSATLSLDREAAELLAEATLDHIRAGDPIPALGSVAVAASDWAFFATTAELRAYLVAAWNHLHNNDRAEFLQSVTERRAA